MSIQSSTRLLGLLGEELGHSLAFPFNNLLLALNGVDAVYLPLTVPEGALSDAIAGIRALCIWGCNVTYPYKVSVIEYMDVVDITAVVAGSVNVVVNRDGSLHGYNTDGDGFVDALAATRLPFSEAGALIYGAGGAGKAVAVGLAQTGVTPIWVCDIIPARAKALAAILSEEGYLAMADDVRKCTHLGPTFVINATR